MSNQHEPQPDPTYSRNFLNNLSRLILEALDNVEAREAGLTPPHGTPDTEAVSEEENTHGSDDASYFERY